MKFKYKILCFIFFFMSIIPAINGLEVSSCIDVRGLHSFWINGMNNNIRVINFGNEVKYFKECKEKLDIKSEVQRIIREYFEEYLPNDIPNDKNALLNALSDAGNIEKFSDAGFPWDRKSSLFKYINNEIDSSYLGISKSIAKKLSINLKNLFLYASRELVHRNISVGIKKGELQTTLAVKQLATYKLAQYLGIDNIVVKSEFVKLITDHGEKLGIITDKTEGVEMPALENMHLEVAPNLQKELTNLQILDTITNEQDHNPGNCSFKIRDNHLVGIMAFDNEGGFGMNTSLKNRLCWGKNPPLVTEKQTINLPHMDKNLAEKILNTQDQDIDNLLKDIVSEEQLNSLKTRLNKVKSAVNNTISGNSSFLLEDNEWSKNTLSEEISGDYGDTYLLYYLKKLNLLNK